MKKSEAWPANKWTFLSAVECDDYGWNISAVENTYQGLREEISL